MLRHRAAQHAARLALELADQAQSPPSKMTVSGDKDRVLSTAELVKEISSIQRKLLALAKLGLTSPKVAASAPNNAKPIAS